MPPAVKMGAGHPLLNGRPCGGGGIRTREGPKPLPDLQSGALDHSATPEVPITTMDATGRAKKHPKCYLNNSADMSGIQKEAESPNSTRPTAEPRQV